MAENFKVVRWSKALPARVLIYYLKFHELVHIAFFERDKILPHRFARNFRRTCIIYIYPHRSSTRIQLCRNVIRNVISRAVFFDREYTHSFVETGLAIALEQHLSKILE